MRALSPNERWLLSYYRTSEISGSLLFGRLARILKSGPIQADMTRHFADEAQHARYWTDCLAAFGEEPLRLRSSYQDQYLEAGGMPANLMEILAVTLVFERRVARQYRDHLKVPDLAGPIASTIRTIVEDEKWHIRWVSAALDGLAGRYGAETIRATVKRYADADEAVYEQTLAEYDEVVRELKGAVHPNHDGRNVG